MKRIYDPKLKEFFILRFKLREQLSEELLDAFELKLFEKGEYLCRQEEELGHFYLLVGGKLQVDYLQVNGTQAVFAFETPFSIIGDLEIFEDLEVIGNVQALEQSTVLAAQVEVIRRNGYDDPRFLRFINRYLVKKLLFASTLLSQVPLSMENRLARYLLYRMQKEGRVIQLENRESLAAIMGVSVRHLNRTIRNLVKLEAIEIQTKKLTITDPGVLTGIIEKGT